MTREEAIAYFKRHIDLYCVTGICREAEEMAIQALEQQSMPTIALPDIDKKVESYKKMLKHPVIKHIMDETQEQLDFIRPHKQIPVTLAVSGYDKLIDLANAIENDDSDYWTNKKISSALRNISSIEPQSCEDTISRQAAIDANCYNCSIKANGGKCSKCDAVKVIEKLPPVKPQERTGYWIDTGSGQECSECHEIQYGYDNHRFYCGNCGAKMEVEQNG